MQKSIEVVEASNGPANANKRKQRRARATSASGRGRGNRVSDEGRNQMISPSNGQAENSDLKVCFLRML